MDSKMNKKNIKNLPYLGKSHGISFYFRSVADLRNRLDSPEYRVNGVDYVYVYALLKLAISTKYFNIIQENKDLYLYFYSPLKKSFIGVHTHLKENVFNLIDIHFLSAEIFDFLNNSTHIIKIPDNIDIDHRAFVIHKEGINKRPEFKKIETDIEGIQFGFARTSHITKSRKTRGSSRLPYSIPVIHDILKHFITSYLDILTPYIYGSIIREKKLVISVYNKKENSNTAILVAINFGIPYFVEFTLISAIAEPAKPLQKFLFKNEERISMNTFDLDASLDRHADKMKRKKKNTQKKIEENLSSGCGIWKGSTINECFSKMKE